jgi:hypothetical protein
MERMQGEKYECGFERMAGQMRVEGEGKGEGEGEG